ncbi:MAG: LacI family DNA-binding transcriptional regulator [Hamadaea sp.]|uniref:LacI family DNA-binding transcriptional regulator n=1 Tax=Hamadaea sp. TaxID=2024425 RepID=UPI0017A66657|nr:LacI family DNA-binding transcriptional regulator [Hamadaea sp.]NUT20701.1 LacI family DNA-binding transcriptional regulator [Hamadaea sp.]
MARRLAEVAKHVGVSQATVSRVLNDKPGISVATRAAVLTALDVLGYERPAKLRGDRARLVGLILPEMQNPIFPAFAEVVAGALAKRGLSPVLCPRTVDGVSEADYLTLLLDQHVSGVILASGNYQYAHADHTPYAVIRDRSLPAVLLNAAVPGLGLPRVSTDDDHALEQAYRHLVALGHQRIGLIAGPSDHVPSVRKISAYRRLNPGAGLIAYAGFSMEEGHAAAQSLLDAGATGIVCASDAIALGVIRAARRRGLSTPADVSVIGCDDSSLMTYTDPPLTTIRQPVLAMGEAAVALLLGQLDGAPPGDDELLFEPELVVRETTGPAPQRSPSF